MTASPLRRWKMYSTAVLVGITISLALVAAAELGFRWIRNGTFRLPQRTWVADRDLIYKLDPANPDSPQSFRGKAPGPKLSGRLRIVCLGGSTTYGHGVLSSEAWPAVLEEVLQHKGIPAEVINAGVPGYGSRQILLRYRRDIARLSSDVVLFYEGWNRTGALIDPAGWTPYASPGPNAGLTQQIRSGLARHSLILQESVIRGFAGRQKVPVEKWSADPYHDVFVSDVETLTHEILANGQRAILMVYPALYYAAMSAGEAVSYAPMLWDSQNYRPEMMLELERKHQALRQVAASTGAAVIDVQQQFNNVHGAARRALFIDAEHLSVLGNRKLAEIVGECLARSVASPILNHATRPGMVDQPFRDNGVTSE